MKTMGLFCVHVAWRPSGKHWTAASRPEAEEDWTPLSYCLNHQVCVWRPPSWGCDRKQSKAVESNQKQLKAFKSEHWLLWIAFDCFQLLLIAFDCFQLLLIAFDWLLAIWSDGGTLRQHIAFNRPMFIAARLNEHFRGIHHIVQAQQQHYLLHLQLVVLSSSSWCYKESCFKFMRKIPSEIFWRNSSR